MAANGTTEGDREIPEDEARAEAERLLQDPRFIASDRHKAFLRYIIDALFDGRSDAVKAYAIAIDVFNRPSTFDASADPIVRIEATRLREALAKYYEQLGDEPGIRLDIARGRRYLPIFLERHTKLPRSPEIPPDEEDLEPEPPQATGRVQGRVWWYAVAGLAGLGAAGLAGFAAFIGVFPVPTDTEKPLVSLSMNADEPSDSKVMFMDSLALSIGRFGTVRLRSGSADANPYPTNPEQSSYDLKIRYGENKDGITVWLKLSDTAAGEVLWTDSVSRSFGETAREETQRALVYGLSRQIAGPSGVINGFERNRALPAETRGNVCVLRGDFAVETRDAAGLKLAQHCLEETIAARPSDADATAALARVYVWLGRTTGDDNFFQRGLQLANKAARLSPSSPRTALAQMSAQYQLGQTAAAIAAGRRGVDANPENADLLAKLSLVVFVSGSWEDGMLLARRASDIAGQPIRDASFVMILDAYRREKFEEAIILARQVPASDTPIVVLRLAAIARLGDRDAAQREIDMARIQHPDLDRSVSAMFSGTGYERNLASAVRRGLVEAGLEAPSIATTAQMLR
ncbi:tetratricopeptide repeat protein [Rhizobium sp. ZW T2_16]|uniref:tetratricopeptide repeat protein n=1 Tax=Rhizobium sp. ZW T2_16 TaxID=3378083 RepID=UPI003853F111